MFYLDIIDVFLYKYIHTYTLSLIHESHLCINIEAAPTTTQPTTKTTTTSAPPTPPTATTTTTPATTDDERREEHNPEQLCNMDPEEQDE